MSEETKSPQTYQHNLRVLQEITAKLDDTEQIDVDELIPLLDKAQQAYDFCKQRLDEVEQAMQERIKPSADDKQPPANN